MISCTYLPADHVLQCTLVIPQLIISQTRLYKSSSSMSAVILTTNDKFIQRGKAQLYKKHEQV